MEEKLVMTKVEHHNSHSNSPQSTAHQSDHQEDSGVHRGSTKYDYDYEHQAVTASRGPEQTDQPVPQVASSTVTGRVRKKRSLGDKICRVCGDKALAHNFDVITCESCKAFFRRNAIKREELRECAFQRLCPINIRTRRFCSACRLKKCFDIGMRADMILDESKKRARMEKLALRRTTIVGQPPDSPDRPVSSASSDSGSYTDSQPGSDDNFTASDNTPPNANSSKTGIFKGSNGVIINGTKGSSNNNGDYGAGDHHHSNLHNGGGDRQYHNGSVCPDYPLGGGQGFEPVPVSKLPSDPHMYWRLTEDERALLTQITATYQDTILRLPRQGGASERTERAVNSITLEDLLGRCDVCANNVVKLMKGLADYRTLQVEDQLAALKACAMRTLILKGAACFVVERDAWIKAYGELPVSLFVRVTGHEKLIRQHAAFCRSLKMLLKNDVTMYALLQCVMLFDPGQPNIADRQLVNTLRDKYLQLLKHYLESQVSYLHAEQYLDHLKDRLAELTVLGQKMTDMFREWTGLIQPLMIEVLSLA